MYCPAGADQRLVEVSILALEVPPSHDHRDIEARLQVYNEIDGPYARKMWPDSSLADTLLLVLLFIE